MVPMIAKDSFLLTTTPHEFHEGDKPNEALSIPRNSIYKSLFYHNYRFSKRMDDNNEAAVNATMRVVFTRTKKGIN
ncbi:Hypothetical predicted protein [Octopus vulgaris]|uniref:Uncharacterized protein n=1 Tax=Octopus vulgaris TaxID=6645 RepID=A0AA36B216_OCTVU|nr:Hypothetical predicted protein [Octopus vulgaris]